MKQENPWNGQIILQTLNAFSMTSKASFVILDSAFNVLISGGNNPLFYKHTSLFNADDRCGESWEEDKLLTRSCETKKIITLLYERGLVVLLPVILQNDNEAVGMVVAFLGPAEIKTNGEGLAAKEWDLSNGIRDLQETGVVSRDECNSMALLYKLATCFFEATKSSEGYQKQVKKMQKKIRELETQLAQSEIQSVENQIKPHFLFNTLNLVARLIYLEKCPESLEVVYALSKLLRYSMEKKELVRVRDELQYIKNYLFIQKNRYGEQLSFQIDVSQNTLGGLIPALALQPLVGNSIKHGLEPKGGGLIKIVGRVKGQRLVLKVIDDGIGFNVNDDNLNKGVSKNSIGTGIKNIEKRIKFYFNEDCDLRIVSKPGKGTEVTIAVPFISDLEDDYIPVFWFDK